MKGLAALVLDARTDERFGGVHSILDSGVRSLVAAPLLGVEGCLGMIALNSRLHVRQFSAEDLELLVSLASVAALRIRNVALAEEAAERRRLEAGRRHPRLLVPPGHAAKLQLQLLLVGDLQRRFRNRRHLEVVVQRAVGLAQEEAEIPSRGKWLEDAFNDFAADPKHALADSARL